jgi:uncharacterized membrane protein
MVARKHLFAAGAGAFGLLLCSAAAVALLLVRVRMTDDPHFAFLAWNLFLAWIPMGLAVLLFAGHRGGAPSLFLAAPFGLWLLFLPNAPYLVTDFIHLAPDSRVPLWFDFALLAAFASSGLLLGFASVYLVQRVVSERFGRVLAWTTVLSVFALSGVGIYMGRVLRLNSWDAIQEPESLLSLAIRRLEDPLGNPLLLATILLFTTFLTAAYVVIYTSAAALRRGHRILH